MFRTIPPRLSGVPLIPITPVSGLMVTDSNPPQSTW